LAVYVFTRNSKVADYVAKHTSSGAVLVNDVLMHATVRALPFGGVGPSGMGRYNGYRSFETFTYERTVMTRRHMRDPGLRYRTNSSCNSVYSIG